jgi:hypothetical protein
VALDHDDEGIAEAGSESAVLEITDNCEIFLACGSRYEKIRERSRIAPFLSGFNIASYPGSIASLQFEIFLKMKP